MEQIVIDNKITNRGKLNKTLKKEKILIFSTDRELCQNLSLFFEDIYKVVSTINKDKIANLVTEISPDVLIVDLPTMDSSMLEILKEAEDRNKKMHIVLMFSYHSKETDVILSTMRTLVDAIFYKPVDVTQLANVVGKILAS
jgi:DNA-binding NtrC family response regulator